MKRRLYNLEENFLLDLVSALDQSRSQKRVNADIKTLEKTINMLRLTATLAKGSSKKEINAYIKTLSSQLSTIKLRAKIDSKNLKSEINSALGKVSFKDIDVLNIDGNKTKLKAQKVIADTKAYIEKNPINIGINYENRRNKLDNDLTAYLNRHTKISESSVLLKEADKVRNLIGAINDKKSLREATDAFQLYRSEVSATGFNTKSTTDKIKDMLSHVTKISSALGVATMLLNNFTKSMKTLRENDTVLTEISKTSELTKNQLRELGDEAFKTASKYGQLSSNYLLGVQEMARSGYEDMSKELGELSLLAQSAGDMTADSANNYLLATDAAYKYGGSIEKLNVALDGANYISNKNSAALTDIADATRVSASFAANAGIAIDELTAAEATMIATTKRSGSEIGRAFRSIILNLQQVSGEFDGEVIDEEQLKKVEARCHSMGVELEYMKDGIATLRNPIEVLKELAEVYNSLPDNSADKQGLISDLGGKYHANALSALLSRWDLYEKMLSEFSQGAGSALEEAEKTANSWEGRLNSLQNSWDSFINTLTNKEAIMGGISFLDRLIQGAETLTDTIGEIPVVLTTLNTAMTAMNKDYGITHLVNKDNGKLDIQGNIFGIDFTNIKNLKKHFSEAEEAINLWNDAMSNGENSLDSFSGSLVQNNAQLKDYLSTCSKDAPASLAGYKTSLNAAGISTDALRLKTILLNSAISMGIGIAIQAAVQGIAYLIQREEELRQATKEAIETFESISSEVETLEDKLSELNDQINQLDPITDAEDIENLKAETEELSTQLAILKEKQRIAGAEADKAAQKSLGMTEASRYKTEERESAYGGVESGASYVTKDEELKYAIEAYDEYKAKVDEANNALAHMAETGEYAQEEWDEQEKTVSTYTEKMGNARAHANELAVSLEEQKQGLSGNTDASQTLLNKIDGVITQYDQWLKKINGTTEALEEQAEAENDAFDGTPNTFGSQLIASQESLDKFKSSVQSAKEAYTTLLSGNYSASELLNSIQAINQAASNMGGSLNWEFINKQKDSLDLLGDAIQLISKKYTESILSGMGIDIHSEFGQMLANMITQAFEAEAAFEGMNSQLDNLQSSYQTLTDVLESYNKTGYISLDSLQSLLTADENLIAMLEVENGQLAINQAAYENLVTAQLMEFKAKLNDAAAAEIEALAKQKAEQATNQNADASNNAVEKLDAETAAFNRNTSAAISNAVAKAEESGVSEEEINGILDKYNEVWNAAVNNFSGDFDGFMGGKSGAGKAGKKAGDAYVDAFEKELKKLQTLRDQGKITEKQYLDYLRKLYQRFFRDKKKYAEQYAKYEHEYLQGMKSLYESALSGITSMLDKQISAYEDSKSAAVESLEAQRDAAIEAKEAEKERYEQEIELINKQIAAKEKAIQKIRDEIEAMETANADRKMALNLQLDEYNLQRQLNQKTKRIYTEDGFKYDIDTSGLKEARQKVEDDKLEIEISKKEKEIKLVEKEIDLLNEKKDGINENIDLLDKQIDQINEYYDKLIADTEKYWDNLIKGLQDYKSRWEELGEIEENAKLISTLKQLGIEVDDVLGMSEEAFSKFKDEYVGILADIYSGNDSMLSALSDTTGKSVDQMGSYLDSTQGYIDSLSGIGDSLDPLAESIGNVEESMGTLSTTASDADENLSNAAGSVDSVNSSLSETATTTDTVATNVGTVVDGLNQLPENGKVSGLAGEFETLATKIGEVAKALGIGEGEAVSTLFQAMNSLNDVTLGNEGEGIIGQFTLLKNAITDVIETIGSTEAQTVGSLMSAIAQLNSISLDESIIAQFTNLKTAIDSVTAAISGGGGESSEGTSSGSTSGSKGGKQGGASGKGSEGESGGGGNSLTGAIESMGETAKEVIGEPDAEGDGTVIGEFGSMETAVNEVRDAIGTEGSEGEGGGSGSGGKGESDDTLVGSIEYLGNKTEEEMGESDGDGILGKFNEFKGVIEEAANQVKSISEGLDEIDGKEVECTITVNVKMNGSIPAFASGTVFGNMQIESATYNAIYGKAFASGTIGLKHDEKNALRSEYGQPELTVYPNGTTELTTSPVMSDLPKGTVIYNEEETKKIMDNKSNPVGNAHADGTDDSIWTTLADGTRVRPLQPGDKMWDLYQKFDAYFKSIDGNLEKLVPNSLYEQNREWNKLADQISYANSVVNNNRNVQQPVTIQVGDINLTGVQDVNGLAHAITTRLPNAMLQEMHRR